LFRLWAPVKGLDTVYLMSGKHHRIRRILKFNC
jgi:hypothetical protein